MKAKQKPACVHCEIGRTRIEMSGGKTAYRVHRWKESNGVDYDWVEMPCEDQPKSGLNAYRRQSLAFVTQRIIEVRGKLAVLEVNAARIKDADHASNIYMALERVKNIRI
jgi:hypothetical protein